MTKPTDSKVTAAFQAMLAFLRYLIMGHIETKTLTPPERIGVAAGDAIGIVSRDQHLDKLIALRDLVQAAADEHAGSAEPASSSAAGDPFAAIQKRHEAAAASGPTAGLPRPLVETDRAWLIGEVKRLKETAEHLGANLKTARAEVLRLEGDWRALSVMVTDQRREADQQRTRADRMAAGIDALVERYSELQRGAR